MNYEFYVYNYSIYYTAVVMFTYTLGNLKNINNFNKIKRYLKNSMLFFVVLSSKRQCLHSPQDKNN